MDVRRRESTWLTWGLTLPHAKDTRTPARIPNFLQTWRNVRPYLAPREFTHALADDQTTQQNKRKTKHTKNNNVQLDF